MSDTIENNTKQCPFCGKTIKAQAQKCRFCGQWLDKMETEIQPEIPNTKQCPYCGEEILFVAKKCKHCKQWLNEENVENIEKNMPNKEEAKNISLPTDADGIQNALIEDIRNYQLGHTEDDMACPTCNYFGKMAITSMPKTQLMQGITIFSILLIFLSTFSDDIEIMSIGTTCGTTLIIISVLYQFFKRVCVKCPKCKSILYLK